MTDERPRDDGRELNEEDLAVLRQRYTAQDVVGFFQALDLPACDDPILIAQVVARDKQQRAQDSLSPDASLRQQAAKWLTAARLLEYQPSRRELLLLAQEAVNDMLTFRLERYGQAGMPYMPDVRAELKASAIRGFALHDDLAERFLRAFEHGCNLRFGLRVPVVLHSINVRGVADETFGATLTTLILPTLPDAPTPAGKSASQYTEPMRALRPKPSVTKISAPPTAPERKPSAPLLMPGDAIAKLLIKQDDWSGECLLTKDATSIGRQPDSDLSLKEDRRVSRQHAIIHRAPTAYILTDLSSANGTFLNGAMLTEPAILRSGDQIRIGHTELTFIMEPLANRRDE
ncbi:MAG TPA: FHA domain-containing protein [Ktedonobacterales bacterium]|jgi:hypothetical protein